MPAMNALSSGKDEQGLICQIAAKKLWDNSGPLTESLKKALRYSVWAVVSPFMLST